MTCARVGVTYMGFLFFGIFVTRNLSFAIARGFSFLDEHPINSLLSLTPLDAFAFAVF